MNTYCLIPSVPVPSHQLVRPSSDLSPSAPGMAPGHPLPSSASLTPPLVSCSSKVAGRPLSTSIDVLLVEVFWFLPISMTGVGVSYFHSPTHSHHASDECCMSRLQLLVRFLGQGPRLRSFNRHTNY